MVTLDPALEDRIAAGIEVADGGLSIRLSPHDGRGHLPADRGRAGKPRVGPACADRAGQPADSGRR